MSCDSSDANSDASYTSKVQDETARKVLVLLQGKDAEIRRLEADATELRNEMRAAKAGKEELALELDDLGKKLNQSLLSKHSEQSFYDKTKAELEFAIKECDAVGTEKALVIAQLRQEARRSREHQLERDNEAARSQQLMLQLDNITSELLYHKELVANLSQRLKLHEDEVEDSRIEQANTKKHETALRDETLKLKTQLKTDTESLKAQLDEQKQSYATLMSEKDKLKKSATESSRAVVELRTELKQKSEEVFELQQEIADLEVAKKELADETGEKINELMQKARHVELFNNEMQNFQMKLDEMTNTLKMAEMEKNRLGGAADTAAKDMERVIEEKGGLEKELEAVHEERKGLLAAHDVLQEECTEAKAQLKIQTSALAEVNSTLTVLRTEQEHLMSEAMKVSMLEEQLHELERHMDIEKRNCEMHETTAAMHQGSLMDVHQQFSEFQVNSSKQVNELEAKLTEMECSLKVKTDQVEVLKEKLEAAEDRSRELEESAITAEQRHHELHLELSEARSNFLKVQKTVKKLKSEKERELESKQQLQQEYKGLSTRGVSEMKKQQEVISLLTAGRDEVLQQLHDYEQKFALVQLKIPQLEDKARRMKKEHAAETAKLEQLLKGLRKELDDTQQRRGQILEELTGTKTVVQQLQTEISENNEAKVLSAKTVATLKRQLLHSEAKRKSLEVKLETQGKQEKERMKQIDATVRQGRDDERRRHEMTVELRKEKAHLTERVNELTSDLIKVEEKNKVLQSASARNMRTISELREKAVIPKDGGSKKAMEWQDFILAQLHTLLRFLLTSNLEVISKVKELRSSKECLSLLAPLSIFDDMDSRTLCDDSLLSFDHYSNIMRTATGYSQGSISVPPKLKVSGGLRDSKRPPDLSSIFISLVTKRIKLEARLADITAI
eukprot:TRINITY_DN30453_c0_g1_i1.p1 TRINITY_DN30453_c0_g1~~TRINITY_DN30453_c0_g1_i1.p1  ORF type:complete len:906 (+),score=313.11 TRINITY_DN30453_c0_g1_i1:30-2747(+)